MTPHEHSLLSVRDFGGHWNDYIGIHEFFDQTKAHICDYRHRFILHNSFGMILCEKLFGPMIYNSDGKQISVREIARRHIIQDMGKVYSLKEIIDLMRLSHDEFRLYNPKPPESDVKYIKDL